MTSSKMGRHIGSLQEEETWRTCHVRVVRVEVVRLQNRVTAAQPTEGDYLKWKYPTKLPRRTQPLLDLCPAHLSSI